MTTYVDFVPSPTGPFQFQATLDGALHNVTVTWNIFGQRWYANVYSLDGTLVVAIPLVGSQNPLALEAVAYLPAGPQMAGSLSSGSTVSGSTAGTMVVQVVTQDDFSIFGAASTGATNQVMARAASPHGYKIGSLVDLVISQMTPDGYNGPFRCQMVDKYSFIYSLAVDPGPASIIGVYSKDVNLVAGYFKTSRLVWRPMLNRFQIDP